MARAVLDGERVHFEDDASLPAPALIGTLVVLYLSLLTVVSAGRMVWMSGNTSKVDTTEVAAKILAFEAYPQFREMHPSARVGCPSARDLIPYATSAEGVRDAWGNLFVLECTIREGGDAIVRVISIGEDGRIDTADDLVVEAPQ